MVHHIVKFEAYLDTGEFKGRATRRKGARLVSKTSSSVFYKLTPRVKTVHRHFSLKVLPELMVQTRNTLASCDYRNPETPGLSIYGRCLPLIRWRGETSKPDVAIDGPKQN